MEAEDGTVRRCPTCHPLSPLTLVSLRAWRDQLAAEVADVERRIAEAEANEPGEWDQGPGRPWIPRPVDPQP